MEIGLNGLDEIEINGAPDPDSIRAALSQHHPNRILYVAQAMRHGLSLEDIHNTSKFDPWFLDQIKTIVDTEQSIRINGLPKDKSNLLTIKKMGFSDARLAKLTGISESNITSLRNNLGVHPIYKRVDTCSAEFPTQTSYMYSSYEGDGLNIPESEVNPTDSNKVIILGGGPNRIGQGIEFDYCCVHAAYAMKDAGYEAIMVNCNPETVSTDYDTSDRLYFEPLTNEDVIELIRAEKARGTIHGVIVQFGGQTPLKLAAALEKAEVNILGTSPDAIDLAEDRQRFQKLLGKLGLKQPPNGIARSTSEAERIADKIGYPVVIRPSYVLGGRAMEIVHDVKGLRQYMEMAVTISGENPILIDWYLRDAIEVDVDAICDGNEVYVAGIMEHIEEAGIHSGDSACSLPPHSLSNQIIKELRKQTKVLAIGLNVIGLMNIQFAIQNDIIFILEVNPRASRTVPFVAKATGVPIAKISARIMAGEKLSNFNLTEILKPNHVAVKEAVFPFSRFPGVDIILGPEMKSTGEVMGIDSDFPRAFAKSQLGAGVILPSEGTVFISVKDGDKRIAKEIAYELQELGFKILATGGTAKFLTDAGIKTKLVNKVLQGRPHCVDAILSGEVQMVINTTEGPQAIADSFSIRNSSLLNNVPQYTTITGAAAAISAIKVLKINQSDNYNGLEVKPLQFYVNQSL